MFRIFLSLLIVSVRLKRKLVHMDDERKAKSLKCAVDQTPDDLDIALSQAQEQHEQVISVQNERKLLVAWRDSLVAQLASGRAHVISAGDQKIRFHDTENVAFQQATAYLYRTNLMGPGRMCGHVWYDMFRTEVHVERDGPQPFEQMVRALASMAGYSDFLGGSYRVCACDKTAERIVKEHVSMMHFANRYVSLDFPLPVEGQLPILGDGLPRAMDLYVMGDRRFEDAVDEKEEAKPAVSEKTEVAAEERDQDGTSKCITCSVEPVGTVLLPCAHACLCKKCYGRMRSPRCPMCRSVVSCGIAIILP